MFFSITAKNLQADRLEIENLTGWQDHTTSYISFNNGKYQLLWKLTDDTRDVKNLVSENMDSYCTSLQIVD